MLLKNRPKLNSLYVYGDDIELSEVRVGDIFEVEHVPGSSRPTRNGTITKIKRVNFDYDTVYAPSPTFKQTMHLSAPLRELVGGYVVRDKTVHLIKEDK